MPGPGARYSRAQVPAFHGDNGQLCVPHPCPLPMPSSKPHPGPTAPPTAQVAGTAAFSKFMHVLQLVADAQEPMNVAALMRASGYPRPTVHRIVAALMEQGLLISSLQGASLALGPQLIRLASKSWGRSELRLAALEALTRLRDQTGETVHLAVPIQNAMVFIEKLEGPGAVRMSSGIGTTVCMHATSVGKAYLAALDAPGCMALLETLPLPRKTERTATTREALQALLQQTRARGWAIDDEENEPGVVCFGAAIRDAQGKPIAAISVSTLLFRQKPDLQAAYVAPVLEAAQQIAQRLGSMPASR